MSVSYAYGSQQIQIVATEEAATPPVAMDIPVPDTVRVQALLFAAMEKTVMRLPSMKALARIGRSS